MTMTGTGKQQCIVLKPLDMLFFKEEKQIPEAERYIQLCWNFNSVFSCDQCCSKRLYYLLLEQYQGSSLCCLTDYGIKLRAY